MKLTNTWISRDRDSELCELWHGEPKFSKHHPHYFPSGRNNYILDEFCSSDFRRVAGWVPRKGTKHKVRITIEKVDAD